MLEIGAFDPLWADIHMGPDGAVRMFQAMGATGLMMPIHWGLFSLALHGLAAADRAGICGGWAEDLELPSREADRGSSGD